MKKIFLLPLLFMLPFLMTGCSDDNDFNTAGNITVGMQQATYSVKENKGIFLVPITVKGDANGTIEVDVEVVCEDATCREDVHFLVTSKHLIIPQGKNTVNVEIKSIDDRIINADRTFIVRIVNVKGANKGAQLQTLVTLLDNDNIPYDRMGGEWMVTATNILDNDAEVSWKTNLVTFVDESEEGYGSTMYMKPWRMWSGETYEGVLDIQHTVSFRYNTSSQTATLSLRLGETMAEGFALGRENEEGYDMTNCSLRSATTSLSGFVTIGTVMGTVNEDFTKVTFNMPLLGILYDATNRPFSYWFAYSNIVMTKIQ